MKEFIKENPLLSAITATILALILANVISSFTCKIDRPTDVGSPAMILYA